MAKINGYQFTPVSVQVYPAIWDDKKKQFKPIESMENHDMYEVLDGITLAVESGKIDSHNWPQQLFANQLALEDFLEQLSEYDDCFRINDRWAMALAHLVKSEDCEEGFGSGRDMAQTIEQFVNEYGLAASFGKRKPQYKYSVEQFLEASFEDAKQRNSGFPFCYLTNEEFRKVSDIVDFGYTHYAKRLSTELYRKAVKEGKAIAKAGKKTSKGKAVAAA
jgi:hypothetical protein